MRMKTWETALLIAVALAITVSAVFTEQQRGLSQKLIRLRVVGNSDSAEDQEAKLKVRDAVCEETSALLAGAESRAEAERRIAENLPLIGQAADEAAKRAGQTGAAAELVRESFPTRDYGTFALPAGEYLSLRVTVGEGAGKNWWCVIFPALCDGAAIGGSVSAASLTDSESAFLTSGYTVRFRVLDILEELKSIFR